MGRAALSFTLTLMLSHIESLIDKIIDWFFSHKFFIFLKLNSEKMGIFAELLIL